MPEAATRPDPQPSPVAAVTGNYQQQQQNQPRQRILAHRLLWAGTSWKSG